VCGVCGGACGGVWGVSLKDPYGDSVTPPFLDISPTKI
jgi:hypothetical protein